MSTQSIEWLNQNVLVDETRHGKAWHFDPLKQGDEPNHYPGPIPIADVERRLFPWEPIGVPIEVTFKDERLVLPGQKAWLRDDTGELMGIHTDGYVGHGYRKNLVERVAEILGDELSVASAGNLDGGAKAWVEVSVPDSVQTPEGVEFRPLLLATTSLDGSIATTYKRVITLVVCDNTRACALGEKGQEYKVKHTRNSEVKLAEAKDALHIVHSMSDQFAKQVAELTSQKVTPKQFAKFLDIINPVPAEDYAKREGSGELLVLNKKAITMAERKRDAYMYMYNHDERVTPWKGTAFGVLQAINTYEHHESRANKGTVRLERNMLRTVKGEYESLDRDTNKVLQSVLA